RGPVQPDSVLRQRRQGALRYGARALGATDVDAEGDAAARANDRLTARTDPLSRADQPRPRGRQLATTQNPRAGPRCVRLSSGSPDPSERAGSSFPAPMRCAAFVVLLLLAAAAAAAAITATARASSLDGFIRSSEGGESVAFARVSLDPDSAGADSAAAAARASAR